MSSHEIRGDNALNKMCVMSQNQTLESSRGLEIDKKLLLIFRQQQPQNIIWAYNYFDIINLTNYGYTLLNIARKTLLLLLRRSI